MYWLKELGEKLYINHHFNLSLSPISLQFSDVHYENKFIHHYNKKNILVVRFGLILSAFLFIIYGIVDIYTFPKLYYQLWNIRICIIATIVAFFTFTFFDQYKRHLQFFNIIYTFFIGSCLAYLYSFPIQIHYMYIFVSSYVLFIVASFTITGLRFISAFSVVVFVNIIVLALIFRAFDFLSFIIYIILFSSTTILSAVGAYFSELLTRKLYLKKLYTDGLNSELKLTQKELQQQANHDGLTNLYNRRYLENISKELIKLSYRQEQKISIVILDIDDFKKINDTYGHQAGDRIIMCLANILSSYTRSSDISARIGGDEFVLLLPDTDKKGAYDIACMIRSVVDSFKCSIENELLNFTVSIGVASIDVHKHENIQDALNKADKALYKAKKNGRNQVASNEINPHDDLA